MTKRSAILNCTEKIALKRWYQDNIQKRKAAVPKGSASINQTEDLKNLNLSDETVRIVEQNFEDIAKNKVVAIQGQYYETYD